MKQNKSEKICCEYIKDGKCTLNEREKADCCPKNGLYTKSQVDEMTDKKIRKLEYKLFSYKQLYGILPYLKKQNKQLKAKLKEHKEDVLKMIKYELYEIDCTLDNCTFPKIKGYDFKEAKKQNRYNSMSLEAVKDAEERYKLIQKIKMWVGKE